MTPAQIERLKRKHPEQYERMQYDAVREKCARSFWFFVWFILDIPVLEEKLHKPLCQKMQDWTKRKKLILLPRLHLKSTVFTVGWTLWKLTQDQDLRFLFVSHKAEDSQKFLAILKDYMLSSRFRYFFPEVIMETGKGRGQEWNKGRILIRRNATLKENTIECASESAQVTGRHYDVIIFDDLVTADSVKTPQLIQDTLDYHAHCQSLFDPGALELVIGTRYDFSDLYGTIIDKPELAEEYDITVMQCYDEEGLPIYPSRFTLADDDEVHPDDKTKSKLSLPKLRRVQGSWVFSCQYMNNPIPSDLQTFKREWIRYIDPAELPAAEHCRWFRVGDISSETDTKSSYTCLVTGCVDQHCNTYVTDIWWGVFPEHEVIEELFRGQMVPEDRRPVRVGMGRSAYEKTLHSFMRFEQRKRGLFVPWQFISTDESERTKDSRIRGLAPWFENGQFYFTTTCKNAHLAVEELLRFPRFVRKDIIDAMAIIELIMFPGHVPEKLKETDKPRWLERALDTSLLDDGTKIGNTRVQSDPFVTRMAPAWGVGYN